MSAEAPALQQQSVGETAPQIVSPNQQEFQHPDGQNNSIANSMFDQSNTQTNLVSTSDPSALKQATHEQQIRNVEAEVTQHGQPQLQNFGNAPQAALKEVELSKGKRGSGTTQQTGTVGNASTTHRSTKLGAGTLGKSSFATKSKNSNFGSVGNQFIGRTGPKKVEQIMGIGPGGSDLSQFFTSQGQRHNSLAVTGSRQNQQVSSGNKPQTAGVVGSFQVEANEFVPARDSKLSAAQGPTITNIGFSGNFGAITQTHSQKSGSSQVQQFAQVKAANQNVRGVGSFTMTSTERSKSFSNQRQQRKTGMTSGEYSTAMPQFQNGTGVGFSQMKPFIQGSSLQKTTAKSSLRSQQPAVDSFQSQNGKKPSQFSEYNFFSQKLTQNSIPKNQEIRYRKEMQQLKFYQTLVNQPYILEQQKLKQQQLQFAQQNRHQSHYNGRNTAAGKNFYGAQQHAGRSNTHHGQRANAQTQIDDLLAMQDGPEQNENKDRSTKQTVYQMHSSRSRLHEAALEQKITTQKIVETNEILNSGQIDFDKRAQITADVRNSYSNALKSAQQTTLLKEQNQTEENTVQKIQIVQNESNGKAMRNLTGPGKEGKKSIITQETDLQISTYNASSIEQRAMFDQSPKLLPRNPNQSSQNDASFKHGPATQLGKETITTEALSKPNFLHAKKIDAVGETIKTVTPPVQGLVKPESSSQPNQRNAISAKPTSNNGATTAILPSQKFSEQIKSKAEQEASPESSGKAPVERIEIKQQTSSASYLEQVVAPGVTTMPKPSKFATQTTSQNPLKKQIIQESHSGVLMIQGNRMKKQESAKSFQRVQSMKPIVEPLINKHEDSKTLYWRLNSNMNEDGATVLLEKQTKDGIINADISYHEGSQNAKVNLRSQAQKSEDQPVSQKEVLNEKDLPISGANQVLPKGSKKAILAANSGTFEEQVSGVGVEGLFSVWGPSSQQSKNRQRNVNQARGSDIAHIYGASASREGQIFDFNKKQQRQSSTADGGRRGANAREQNRAAIGLGLDGVDPSNMAHHMQLVNSIINDGSLQNLVFSNGSLNTEYLQQNKSQVARLIAGNTSSSPIRPSTTEEGQTRGEFDQDVEDLDEEEEDDDEHIIVTMLRSMNSKKLETCQLKDMKLEVDIEKIRQDIKLEFFKEIQKKMDNQIESEWQQKLVKFDRIFNKIIAKKLKLDQENALVKKLEDRARLNEERMNNPFYVTLKAQKEEREKFIDFYQNNMLMGFPVSSEHGLQSATESEYEPIESEKPAASQENDPAGDLFKQTAVDIEDQPKQNLRSEKGNIESEREASAGQINSSVEPKEDIFCFYKLQVELPKTFFAKMGDSKVVTADAINLISTFIRREWPVLTNKKRITFRVSFDPVLEVFNTVPLGKEAPLSKCCMRNVNFVFPRRVQEGGRVLCTDPICMKSVIDTFEVTEPMIHSLFNRGLRRFDMPMMQETSNFMDSRRQMQHGMYSRQKLGNRYQSAVSYEISKRISAGNYKQCKLEEVITHPKFQRDHMASGRTYEAQDLMDMILSVPSKQMTNIGAYQSHSKSNSIHNENQMLAELIQKKAISSQKHKASLPISKLMRGVQNRVDHAVRPVPQSVLNEMQGEHQLMDEAQGYSGLQVQQLDSMFHASNQLGLSNEVNLQGQPKLDNILYQDNASSVQQDPNHLSNADIPDASPLGEIDRQQLTDGIVTPQNRDFSSFAGQLLLQDGHIEYAIASVQQQKTQSRENEESGTIGNTILTGGELDEAKYSHSKSPMNITAGISKETQQSKQSPQNTLAK